MNAISPNLMQPSPVLKAADSLVSFKTAYQGLKGVLEGVGRKGLRWFLAILLAVSLVIPVGIILAIILRKVKKATHALWQSVAFLDKLIEGAKATHASGESVYHALGFDKFEPQDYARLKQGQDLWLGLEHDMESYGNLEQAPLPAWLTLVLRPLSDFYLAFRAYNERFTEVLRLFDLSSDEGPYLKKVSENELWQRRNKAYEYFI